MSTVWFHCTCGFSMSASGKNPMPKFSQWIETHLAATDGEEHASTDAKTSTAKRRRDRSARREPATFLREVAAL